MATAAQWLEGARPRTLPAVSGFTVQIGSTAFITNPTSTACTGRLPNTG
jgi:1,4-dihydroxy-2-naphthoate octaprenyltransferase